MELRRLRYFVAVAEAGSLKLAAEEKLHTTQPSLSRQIRDLENEVGTALFRRSARGVQSVRHLANPAKPSFTLGFMISHDSTWLPKAMEILRDQLPHIRVVISTQNSPQLGTALVQRSQVAKASHEHDPKRRGLHR